MFTVDALFMQFDVIYRDDKYNQFKETFMQLWLWRRTLLR